MSRAEIRAGSSLASIFALRMLGLFLILPVFAIHAKSLPDGDNATLVGLAMGIYGLTQACLQIPFGIASDKFGRKRIIVIGLILFACGALIAALSHTVMGILIGRAVQGAGAISAAITALIADVTREEHRTKAMAMVGGSIGLTFALSLVAAPALYQGIGMDGIFSMTALLAVAAIAVVIWVTPAAPATTQEKVAFSVVLKNPELMRLNYGVFVLHLTQVAMFVVVPSALIQYADMPLASHWKVYLPAVLGSFFAMLPAIIIGEKQGRMKQVFIMAIALLLAVQIGFWQFLNNPAMLLGLLFAFFLAFNILEASQPSLVSRIAPPAAKGAALGVYNTLQALGLACGGLLGGWVKQHAGASSVFAVSAFLTLLWLIIANNMPELPRRAKASQQLPA
ncbi:MFS transporter [Undibacterium sp. Jales W-56]|uniref:MFS transporter n=1 Tax=Undibacterium sp. Jales W-56 TaxID=2897325 RepID=UPI0021D3A45A|nr:MFS transporter [Undibacterium sp. Jales W-56]MCU6435066.1 MFS transporter [Undibacterium sp. Jales W-56]